jgi:hypothetical protein
MWIVELLENSWSESVFTKIKAFKEDMKGDRIVLFFVFIFRENIGYTNEAIIAAEQELTREKLALENFNLTSTSSQPLFANALGKLSMPAFSQQNSTSYSQHLKKLNMMNSSYL